MFKWFSILLALLGLFVSFHYGITEIKGYDFSSEVTIYFNCLYAFLGFLSGLILLLVSDGGKKEEPIKVSDVNIDQGVFVNLTEAVLKDKSELTEYKIKFQYRKGQGNIHVIVIPNLSEKFSFSTFAEKTSQEIEEGIKNYTSFERVSVKFSFKKRK